MRKVIGIMPLYDDEKQSYWMLPGYMKMLEAENAIPLMLPLTSKVKELDYFSKFVVDFCSPAGMMCLRLFIMPERNRGAVPAANHGMKWSGTS